MTNSKPISSTVTLDAKLASWLLNEIQPFVADRALSKRNVSKLAIAMLQGQFLPDITILAVGKLGDTTYRINGQHTAKAVLDLSDKEPDFAIPGVTLLTFSVDTEEDLRQLYARFDRGAARTNMDVTKSILSGIPEFSGVRERTLKLLPIGLAFRRHQDPGKRQLYSGEMAANDVQGEFLELSQKIAAFLDTFDTRTNHQGYMFRGPVVAALYATFDVDADAAYRFWYMVATGLDIPTLTDPAGRLRQLLMTVNLAGGVKIRGAKSLIGAEYLYRACLQAWNRFRDGKDFGQVLRPTVLTSRPAVK